MHLLSLWLGYGAIYPNGKDERGIIMISFLMLGSLILGLIAWILPIINISKYKVNYNKNWATYSIMSMSSCAIAINLQVIYSNHIVQIGDWTALMDTSGTSTLLSLILLIGALALNLISLAMHRTKKQ